jgi:hypothetical protein
VGEVVPIRPGIDLLKAPPNRWAAFSSSELIKFQMALASRDEYDLYDEVARESTRRRLTNEPSRV